jgi:galactokinase
MSLGFHEPSARSRAALITEVDYAFVRQVGHKPAWRLWVPGRVEFFGKHTDYAGGRSLIAAVPRGFAVAANRRGDDVVRVIDARRGVEAAIHQADTSTIHHGWSTYVATVVRRLAANFPGARLGADVVVASDLPSAAGLSSSSAFIVGLVGALMQCGALTNREEWREMGTIQDFAGYLGAVEAGASYGRLAGTTGVGTHGGSEDHTAIVACCPGMISEYRYVPVRHLGDVSMPAAWTCVIATSGVHADKIGSARDRFNRAAAAVRALVDLWRQITHEQPASLAAALMSAPDASACLSAAIPRVSVPDFSAGELARRLTHFLREDPRVPDAARAFAGSDAAALDALSRDSQDDAKALLGNQVAETIALVAAARSAGALAASSFGAGFGGSVWALVPAEDVDRFGPAWLERYRAQHSHIAGVEWFAAPPSPPLLAI